MMPVLDRPIAKAAWQHEVNLHDGAALAPTNTRAPQQADVPDAGAWEPAVQAMVAMQHLENDWDGFGAEAPSRAVLESAIGLAYCFHDNGVPPPQRVAPGVSGSVILEWQDPDGTYAEVEIDRPLHAEVMVIEPGKPARQWTLPTE